MIPVPLAFDGDTRIGMTTADMSDNWTFDYTDTSLDDGSYSFTALATDAAGNTSAGSAAFVVEVDTAGPVVTVDSLTTTDTTPQLTGTVNDSSAVVQVTVDGKTYAAANNGDGTWTLADNTISPALVVGTYNVLVTATGVAGNVGTDGTLGELVIQATQPTIAPVDHLVKVSLHSNRYDRRTGQSLVHMRIRNTPDMAIEGPMWIVIKAISNPNVTLAESSGITPEGDLYIDVTSLLPNGRLDPGKSIDLWLAFKNPTRRRFDVDFSIWGLLV